MKKGQVSPTRVFASSPIHGMSRGAYKQSGVLVREVARAMEEQMKEDEHEPKTWEEKKQVSET